MAISVAAASRYGDKAFCLQNAHADNILARVIDGASCNEQVSFRNPIRYGLKKELFIAPEGLYTGQVTAAA